MPSKRSRAQESSNAISRMYITMRHLFNRGFYKPMGISGSSLRKALLTLKPEIYGSIAEEKTEIKGLHYIFDRLPQGIEECTSINLTSDEGLNTTHFVTIVPKKRRRNCYRVDPNQMVIEITRGRSEIYDILTHLTFMYLEADKILKKSIINTHGDPSRNWVMLEQYILQDPKNQPKDLEIALTYLAPILGRSYDETREAQQLFETEKNPNRLLKIIYHLGKNAIEEDKGAQKRDINFSVSLRERIGHHIHGEAWSNQLKEKLEDNGLLDRPIHIISSNMHSVMNVLYAPKALGKKNINYSEFINTKGQHKQQKVFEHAQQNGLTFIKDKSGCNVDVQIIDCDCVLDTNYDFQKGTVLIVFDYAFGEQAYEIMDELLKPYSSRSLDVQSISVMGKAGILKGKKGDIMIPSAHVFEGSSDNYPFVNDITVEDLSKFRIDVYQGSMVTVLGTSLQNKEILNYFYNSTWNAIGIEMEGVHYQKAIQAAMYIRQSISTTTKVRYAYYASDNPLESGGTLASGPLGVVGVGPTYAITSIFLEKITNSN